MKLQVMLLAVLMNSVSVVGYGQTLASDTTSITARVKLPPVAARSSLSELQAIANRVHGLIAQQTHRTVSAVELLSQSGTVIAKFTY